MHCVVDTNIINWLIDGTILPEDLPSDAQYVATHVQIDELNNTLDQDRRARLFLKFAELQPRVVPTESAVWGITRWGQGKWGDGVRFQKLKDTLDKLNKSKANNSRDVLIAEVALANEFTLLTADNDLANALQSIGGKVVLFKKPSTQRGTST